MRQKSCGVVYGSLGICLLAALFLASCGDDLGFTPALASTGRLDIVECQVDRSPEAEVLYLTWEGGLGMHTPQYRLFGDGRLLREVVQKTKPNRPLLVDEVHLSQDDLDLIFEAIVRGRLAAMTHETLRDAMGDRRFRVPEDYPMVKLRVQFSSCGSSTGSLVPYSNTVYLAGAEYLARKLPEVRELQALVTVIDALAAYFPESAAEALREERTRNQE
ncbi:MAG: hypothetical protein WBN87_06495 [Thermoanaerobaculia bacterium]